MREAEMHLDVNAEIAVLLVEYGYLAERGAEAIAEEIRDQIEISDIPAAPGEAPHSRGPYRDSWKSGKARKKRSSVTAAAFSMAMTATGDEALALVLDEGRGPTEPHPHIHAGIERARRKIDAEVQALNARLRGGAL